jgi:PAS domain S-box-containing protein
MCPDDRNVHVRLLARIVDEASDFVLITDFTPPSQGGPFIEYANESLLQATGFALEELAGKPYGAIIAEENDPRALETINHNLEAARVNEKEILLRRKNGSSFWVEFAGKPLRDENSGSQHWVSVGRDITLRKQSMEQLATLMTAMDSVSGHLEIYALEGGDYTAIFRNREADSDISELVETLLNDPRLRGATALRERLSAGESVTLTSDGLQIRPCDGNASTLVCIKQKAS